MVQTVKGIYRDGKVELLEPLSGVAEGEVIRMNVVRSPEEVAASENASVVVSQPSVQKSKMLRFGMFSNGTEQFAEADFKAAEYYGDDDFEW